MTEVAGIVDFDEGSVHHVTDMIYEASGVHRYRVPRSKFPVLGGTERLYRQVPRVVRKIDREYAAVLFPRHTLLAGVDPRGFDAAICPLVHDLAESRSGEGNRLWRKALKDSLKNVSRADRVIAISEMTKDELIHYANVPPDQIKVLTQGVDTDRIYHDETPIDAFEVPEQFVLYAGALLDRKRPEFLLDVLAELDPSLSLVICGNQYTDAGTKLVDTAKRRGLANRLQFVGYVSDANLRRLYSQALVYFHSAENEGYGRTPVEAATCGTPVVVHEDIPSAADLSGVCRTFDEFDPVTVADLLEASAGETVEFTPRTWDDVAADLEQILAPMVSEAPRQPR